MGHRDERLPESAPAGTDTRVRTGTDTRSHASIDTGGDAGVDAGDYAGVDTGDDGSAGTREQAGVGAGGHIDTDAGVPGGKYNVLGVLVDSIDYDAVIARVLTAARARRPLSLTALAVHGVMTGVRDPHHRARLNAFDIVAPDGQPVRWGLNILYGVGLPDWVSGPELTGRVLDRMADEDLPVYLYGSTPEIIDGISTTLHNTRPALRVVGAEPSKFRDSTSGELIAIAARINSSGARLLLVGLGCPRQEIFAHAMRPLLRLPVMAIGAAFDYQAGRLRPAPAWMQRYGLAWLYRLMREPRRLWRRYLVFNTEYLGRLAAQKSGLWRPEVAVPAHGASGSVPV